MSDALTDIARDQARGQAYSSYVKGIIDYLGDPTDERLEAVVDAAERTDSVRGGYWSGSTNIAEGVHEHVQKLLEDDELEWAKLLFKEADDGDYDFYKLFELSPFEDASVLCADHGVSFVNVNGNFLDRLLTKKGFNRSCANFLIVIPDEFLDHDQGRPRQLGG